MATLAIGSVLFGIFIGKFFRWPMLVPAFGLVIIFILIKPAHAERTPQIYSDQSSARGAYTSNFVFSDRHFHREPANRLRHRDVRSKP
jgi:hypothetical protein